MKRTRLATIGVMMLGLAAFLPIGAARAESTAAEAAGMRDRWLKEHVNEPPFSFVYDGRPSSELLKGWKREAASKTLDAHRTEHSQTWTDPKTGLQARLVMIEYQDSPAVEWLLYLTNTSQADTPILDSVRPLDIRVDNPAGLDLHHSLGDSNSADSFKPLVERIGAEDRATHAFAPLGGRSSDGHMPYFNLDRGDNGLVVAIGWAGQWRAEFAQNETGVLRASAGQELTHFLLHPGETVRTPRILLVFWHGEDDLAGNNALRRLLIAHHVPQRDGKPLFPPICGATAETAPDGSYEQAQVAFMPRIKRQGIEVAWFDMNPQHWYGEFPTDTGTWEPHPKKFPNGLAPVGKAAHAAGLKFLLWFEPERVHPGTKTDKDHPEWVMKAQGEWSQLFALHDAAARRWLTDVIDAQVTSGEVDWIRWDFNVPPLGFWRRNDAADRQGITEIRHVEGLYAMWEELQRRHPGLLIDICASGGRRLDFETCSYGMPLWHSDLQCSGNASPTADQLQNSGLWRWVPMHACGVFDLEPGYGFRSAMTAGNILVPSRDGRPVVGQAEFDDEVRRTVAFYNKVRPYMLGDFYPLLGHDASDAAWHAYQFDRPELGAGMAMIFRREKCAQATQTIRLRGIDPAASYEVSYEEAPARKAVEGKDLLQWTTGVLSAPGSTVLYYRRL